MATSIPPMMPLVDILQYTLPTFLLLALFYPIYFTYLGISIAGIELAIMPLALIFGYVITPPLLRILILRAYPKLNAFKKLQCRALWHETNWGSYSRVFFVLSREDREHLYKLQAYFHLYMLVAFFTFLYFVANAYFLIAGTFIVQYSPGSCLSLELRNVFTTMTPVLGGTSLPTLHLILPALAVAWLSYRGSLHQYRLLWIVVFPSIATVYHREKGGLARRIWGRVLNSRGNGVEGVVVRIVDPSTQQMIEKMETDQHGYYQTKNDMKYMKMPYNIELWQKDIKLKDETQVFDDKSVDDGKDGKKIQI